MDDQSYNYELLHAKMHPKTVVIVIAKEGLGDGSPPILVLVQHRLYTYVICNLRRLHFIIAVVPKEGFTRPPLLLL